MMPSNVTLRSLAGLALGLLAACSYNHNFPSDTAFAPDGYTPAVTRAFVDMNGSFYPDGWWGDWVDPGKKWRRHSLLAEAYDRDHGLTGDRHARLAAEEQRQLDAIAAATAGKRRVFVFVHGFNSSQAESDEAYAIMARTIAFTPEDALIDFYWDGYVAGAGGKGVASPVGFWFKAVANSQMAGMYGLRRVLARLDAGQVVLISHSRGVSVVLSALSNPPFDPKFVAATANVAALEGRSLSPPAPELGAGAIDVIMMAPAIGQIDFCEAQLKPAGQCAGSRLFPAQLRSLTYTVNPADPVLRKYFGLGAHFNPTDLGLHADVGAGLESHYPFMRAEPIAYRHAHGFPCYASDPEFAEMLGKIGVASHPARVATSRMRPLCKPKLLPG